MISDVEAFKKFENFWALFKISDWVRKSNLRSGKSVIKKPKIVNLFKSRSQYMYPGFEKNVVLKENYILKILRQLYAHVCM